MTFSPLPAPKTKKHQKSETIHDITRHDPYAWLKAENWQDVFHTPSVLSAEIRTHLEEENIYQAALMADTKDLQQNLFHEMKGRIKEDDSSVPVKDGPFAYGVSYVINGEQPRFIRTARNGGNETVFIDGDKEAEGKDYFQFGTVDHSNDHKLALWAFDDKGSEFYTIRVRDLETLQDLEDQIEKTGGDGVWDANSQGFFYTKLDESHRPSELYYHRLGTKQDDDTLIFREDDPGFFMSVDISRLEDYIFIDLHDHTTSEVWLIPAHEPLAKPHCVKPRERDVEYSLISGGDVFYILTNAGGAKDFKIMTAPVDAPKFENWQELIAHQSGRLILSHDVYQDHLVWLERDNCLPCIQIVSRKNGEQHAIAFAEEAYSLGLQGAAEYDTSVIRFSYSSMTTPNELFDYDMQSRERTLLKTQEVPSGHNSDQYITRRLFACADDGEQIPLTLLYRKETALDGSAPCLLYGYGAYGMTMPAAFNTNALSLVDRGFIYAIAHIRGGMEKGYEWYEKGKHTFKKNTFTDFIACGRYLVKEQFTSHDRLIAEGGSAGGMLMGAVANMAPQDYAGIVAVVPFVDVLNTMLDASLPLTPPEWPEWGNPIASKDDYELIASYSPYDNVRAQAYPHILAMAGLTDPRVTYWEPAKWVARLREEKTDNRPVLFRINMDAGHAGASGRFSRLEETAFIYAYILKVIGKKEECLL